MFGKKIISLLTKRECPAAVTELPVCWGADIWEVSGSASYDLCNSIINKYKDSGRWSKALTMGEQPEDAKTSARQSQTIGLGDDTEIDGQLYNIFAGGLAFIRGKYSHIHVDSDEGYQLLRYQEGMYYKHHVDHGMQHPRTLSAVLYLNDDYDGGELDFCRQGIKIKPRAGSLLLFPSAYTHEHASLSVENGTKYSIVTWFR